MSEIRTIGVCGLGQMGAAVSVSFKRAGYRVLAWNHHPARLESLHETTTKLDTWMDKHSGAATATGGVIEAHAELNALDAESDVILDCIAEDMALKVDLFKRFPRARDRDAIFITTTSGLFPPQSTVFIGNHFQLADTFREEFVKILDDMVGDVGEYAEDTGLAHLNTIDAGLDKDNNH